MLKWIAGLSWLAATAGSMYLVVCPPGNGMQILGGLALAGLLIFGLYSVLEGIQKVPQQERWNVEYVGRRTGYLNPGPRWIFPWIEKCPEERKVQVWIRKLQLFKMPIKADFKDGAASPKDAFVYIVLNYPGAEEGYKPDPDKHDPKPEEDSVYKAAYAVENLDGSVVALAENGTRSYLNSLYIQEALQGGRGGFDISQKMPEGELNGIKDQLAKWGVRLVKITIGDFDLDQKVLDARDSIMEAEKAAQSAQILIEQTVADTTETVIAQFARTKGFKDIKGIRQVDGKDQEVVVNSARDQAIEWLNKPENEVELRKIMGAIQDLLVRRVEMKGGALLDIRGLKSGLGLEAAAVISAKLGQGGIGGTDGNRGGGTAGAFLGRKGGRGGQGKRGGGKDKRGKNPGGEDGEGGKKKGNLTAAQVDKMTDEEYDRSLDE